MRVSFITTGNMEKVLSPTGKDTPLVTLTTVSLVTGISMKGVGSMTQDMVTVE